MRGSEGRCEDGPWGLFRGAGGRPIHRRDWKRSGRCLPVEIAGTGPPCSRLKLDRLRHLRRRWVLLRVRFCRCLSNVSDWVRRHSVEEAAALCWGVGSPTCARRGREQVGHPAPPVMRPMAICLGVDVCARDAVVTRYRGYWILAHGGTPVDEVGVAHLAPRVEQLFCHWERRK